MEEDYELLTLFMTMVFVEQSLLHLSVTYLDTEGLRQVAGRCCVS